MGHAGHEGAWYYSPASAVVVLSLAAAGWAACCVANILCVRAAGRGPASMRAVMWRPLGYEEYCAKWRNVELHQHQEVSSLQGMLVLEAHAVHSGQTQLS